MYIKQETKTALKLLTF